MRRSAAEKGTMPKRKTDNLADGIEKRHARGCRSDNGGRCNCNPSYRVRIWNGRERRREIRSFPTEAAAKAWRHDAAVAIREGKFARPAPLTLSEAAIALLAGMHDGTVRNRSGERYKPAAIRSYEVALRLRILPTFGHFRLTEIRREDVQRIIDAMLRGDHSASTIKNTLIPLRVIFKRAIRDRVVTVNPMQYLEIPADRGRRERFATPSEAAALIAALPVDDRALWATAFYTSLRRGELRELRVSDFDREASTLDVYRALDDSGAVILTKSYAGDRKVPVIPTLRRFLLDHLALTGRRGDDLIFGRTADLPFIPTTIRERSLIGWGWKEVPNPNAEGPRMVWIAARDDALQPITLHEARHSTGSMLRAAGVDFKIISAIMGHSTITITQDRYTHLSSHDLHAAGEQFQAFLTAGRN
jgi:integrase